MATVTRDDGQELSKAERIAVLIALGMTEANARMVVAQADGELLGDVVVLDEAGNVVGQPTSPSLVDEQ